MKKLFTLIIVALHAASCLAQPLAKTTNSVPTPDHVVVLIYENHAYSEIIGATSVAPYINALANDTNSVVFTKSYAIEHPSQPNYLDFFSGSNQGVTDDNLPSAHFTTPNLAAQLIAAGKTFVTYSEDLPSVAYDGGSSANYARKHNPAANWMGTGTNQVNGSVVNQPLTAFPTNFATLPTVSYVVPNQNNDMHNGTGNGPITTGDSWMNTHMASFISWARTHNTLLIVTFDEDDNGPDNHIATIFFGPMVKPGLDTVTINHYSVLRTIEAMYGLSYIGGAAAKTTITNCWKPNVAVAEVTTQQIAVSVTPNPAKDKVTFKFDGQLATNTMLEITDVAGRKAGSYVLTGNALTISTDSFHAGLYQYRISNNAGVNQNGKFVVLR